MCSNNCVSVVDLDYVLIKLNGSDISSLSSYEVVQMFLQSKENLVVELSRKTNHLQFSDAEQNKFDIYTKHENILQLPKDTRDGSQPNTNSISFPLPQKNEIILTLRAFNNVNVDAEPLLTDVEHATVVSKGTQTTTENGFDIKQNIDHNKDIVQSIADHFIEQQHHLFEQCLEPEIDIEGEDEDDDDDDDDIDSNFEYANRLLPDDYTNVVDKLDTILLAQQQQSVLTGNNLITTQTNCKSARVNPDDLKNETQISTLSLRDEEPTKLPKLHLKSKLQSDCPCQLSEKNLSARSGDKASKTAKYGYDESEHIYETIPEDSESEPLYCSPYQSSNYMTAMGSCSSADVLEMQQQTQRVAQWLGLKKIGSRSIHTLSGRLTKQQNRLPNRICTLTNTTSGSSSSGAAYSACGYINIDSDHANQNLLVNQNKEEIDTSSSAYNTGGSNNSASPRQNGPIANLNNENSTSFQIISGALKNTASTIEPFGKCSRIHCPAHVSQKEQIANISQNKSHTDEPHTGPLSAKADVKVSRLQPTEEQQVQSCPQFNAPNLSRYHFVSSQEVSSKIVSGVSKPNAILVHTENVSEEIPMVWKVKRRPDGTRYIVKRPVRNHLHLGIRKNLRNGDLTTTEDDTISEVKIGRYWTKEERKRHIERARERRHHQQLINQPQYPT
ncbi:slo-interacting protein 1 isoform X8 [Drosophila nasuta]|uniref:Slo-interacting protein 1 isoform X4 n=1 Tax=Drosophila albomicans TaxID=7291 RepID=A0A6P8Z648_DROAB|nr:slo-interacting protein 1 isoform X4 [Drosophila albomicans]XP_060661141.1 slo-interacting protein 1 isoform X8 [Drosophila nasuta]